MFFLVYTYVRFRTYGISEIQKSYIWKSKISYFLEKYMKKKTILWVKLKLQRENSENFRLRRAKNWESYNLEPKNLNFIKKRTYRKNLRKNTAEIRIESHQYKARIGDNENTQHNPSENRSKSQY